MLAALRGDAQPGVSVQGRKIRLLDTARKSHVSIMDRQGGPKVYHNSRGSRGLEAGSRAALPAAPSPLH